MYSTLFVAEFHRWIGNRALVVVCALFVIFGAAMPWVDWQFISGVRMSPVGIVLLASTASSIALLTAGVCAGSNLTEQMRQPLYGWLMSLPVRTCELLTVRYVLTVMSIFVPIVLFMASAAVTSLLAGPKELPTFNIIHSSVLGVIVIAIPNSLTGAALILFVATVSRRTEVVLVTTFMVIVGAANWTSMIDPAIGTLLEPSGHYLFSEEAHRILRNFNMRLEDVEPSVNTAIMLNRAIFLALGACLVGLTAKFTRPGRVLRRRTLQRHEERLTGLWPLEQAQLPSATRRSTKTSQLLEICRLTLHLCFGDLLYWFILGVGFLFLWIPHIPHGATEAPIPLFGSFGEQMFGTFSFLHLAMLVLFALSSRFDTVQRNLGQISQTLPVDRMVWLGGWLLSLVIASAFFQVVGGLANLGLQAYYMPQAITLSGHAQSVLLAWIEPLLFGTMSLAVCCLAGSKRAAALVIALLLLAKFLVGACGEPFTLFAPGWMPAIWWSDFTGFELGLRRWCWYGLYWFAITCILLIAAACAGKHGPSPSTTKRPLAAVWWPAGIPVIASLVAAFVIFYPTSRFAKEHATALKARYELLYRHTANDLGPRLTKVAGKVVIDTSRGDATADLYYSLHNDTDRPVSRFHLDWAPVGGYAVSAPGCKNDDETGFAACVLAKPMPPGTDQSLAVHISYHHALGRNETDIGYVTPSAVFLKPSFFPLLGYDPMKEIQDSRDRSKAGLRGPSWIDGNGRDGLRESVFHSQGPVELDVQVSPLRGLTVIGPRHTVDQVEGLAIFAGTLESTKPVWIDGIPVTLFHHPLHRAMLSVISNVAKEAIQYGVKNFGRPNVQALRLVEADMRHSSGKCLPDTVFLSEGIVFDPHGAAPWGHQEDIPAEVVGHEIAHLWWAYQVVPARAPGFQFITESFAQYMSLMLRRDAGGAFAERRMLFKASAQMKGYRESDPDPTVVLSSMRNTDALAYGRGLVTMSIVEKIIGAKELNQVLRRFRESFDIHDNPEKFATLSDFREMLGKHLSGDEKELIDSLFDTNEILTVAKWTKIRKLHAEHARRSNTQGSGHAHH